ncbi:MAG: transposase [Waterburya sp.]
MPNYRRVYIPGGTYFLTLVTYCRRPLFKDPDNIALLRTAIALVKVKKPFKIFAVKVLKPLNFRAISQTVGE